MNANDVIKEDMTLEEKLAAIDAAMNDPEKQKEFNRANGRPDDAPVDPMDMLHCEGCQ